MSEALENSYILETKTATALQRQHMTQSLNRHLTSVLTGKTHEQAPVHPFRSVGLANSSRGIRLSSGDQALEEQNSHFVCEGINWPSRSNWTGYVF